MMRDIERAQSDPSDQLDLTHNPARNLSPEKATKVKVLPEAPLTSAYPQTTQSRLPTLLAPLTKVPYRRERTITDRFEPGNLGSQAVGHPLVLSV